MKKIYLQLTAMLLVSFTAIQAQNVGINTTTPAASAALDVTATNKGMLVPRMTTTQRTAIASPATGLLVYDNTLNAFYYYNGTAWTPFGGATATYPNVELNTSVTTQQLISNWVGSPNFVTLNFSATNNANASFTGGNTWDGTKFTVGATGAGWYQISGNFVCAVQTTNKVSADALVVFLDKNNQFGNTLSTSNTSFPIAISTFFEQGATNAVLENSANLNTFIYLSAGDYLNFKAQNYLTFDTSYTSNDGSTNITIVRLK